MAPVEFEKHIKEQLEERKIKPSSKAWEQIEKRIEVKQHVKKLKEKDFSLIAIYKLTMIEEQFQD